MKTVESWIHDKKVLICVGSGGVGKTTVSAAIALSAARRGRKVLALTVDPSFRLVNQLGINPENPEVQQVTTYGDGRLFSSVLHSKWIFDQFVRRHSKDPTSARKLMENPLYRQLSTTLSGSQEFTSLELLCSEHEKGIYDLIVLDTPPAQHALNFFEAPARLRALFDESVLKWFRSGKVSTDPKWYSKIFEVGTRKVLRTMEILTGKAFIQDLTDFFSNLGGVQEAVALRGQQYEQLLKDRQTGFLMVAGFDESQLREARELYDQLKSRNLEMLGVMVNRVFPFWWGDQGLGSSGFQNLKLQEEFARYYSLFEERVRQLEIFSRSFGNSVPVISLPDRFLQEEKFLDLDQLMEPGS